MIISLNYLKRYLNFDLPDDLNQLVDRIGAQLGAVDERVVSLEPVYASVVVVKVVSCEPIEGSDHLKICLIDDGGNKASDVERNQDGLVQVVCGAPNVEAGQLVAWLPPGSVVPSTYHKEPFTLSVRPMLGQLSNGMLASPKELGISDNHDGILIIDKDASPGDSFSSLYDLGDNVVDIENKMFTHRPDCFGLLGVARELAGIFNQPFSSPDWYLKPAELSPETEVKSLNVVNEIPELVPRFSAVVIDGLEVGPSPIEVQSYLQRMGIRPINNLVDSTNLTMLITGQPLHAYDYDKLKSISGDEVEITVRFPRPHEEIKLLNGKTLKPRSESIMIAAGDKLIGLAGVMGSEIAEVDDKTKTIVLESASFDMYSIRRSSMELGVFSDAVTRFSKGQSPLQTKRVLAICVNQIKQFLGPDQAKIASEVIDLNSLPEATLSRDSLYPPITVKVDYINSRLGSKLDAQQMASLLTNVECKVEVKDDTVVIEAPFWRTDIEIREDVVEEIGRLYGYDNLEPRLLVRSVEPVDRNVILELKKRLRSTLVRAGANELLNYSFISRKLLEKANQASESAFEIANALSPELNFYRPSLSPSLINKVHLNIKAGYDRFALFEIGTYHLVGQQSEAEQHLPKEFQSLALVYASKNPETGAAFYRAKNYLSFLLEQFNLTGHSFKPLNKVSEADLEPRFKQLVRPFNAERSALLISPDGLQLGVVGEYLPSVQSAFKLPEYSAGFEVDSLLFLSPENHEVYLKASKFPSVKQDITLRTSVDISYGELATFLNQKLAELVEASSSFNLTPISIFQGKDDKGSKNYSFRLVISDHKQTLSDVSVNKLLDDLASASSSKFDAVRI